MPDLASAVRFAHPDLGNCRPSAPSGRLLGSIQAPLALVIVCGLFSSTALNMFVVPTVYWTSLRGGSEPRDTTSPA